MDSNWERPSVSVVWVPFCGAGIAQRPAVIFNGKLATRPWDFVSAPAHTLKSSSWFADHSRVIRLMHEFWVASNPVAECEVDDFDWLTASRQFASFSHALAHGTVDRSGADKLRLYWGSLHPASTQKYIAAARNYLGFLASEGDPTLSFRAGGNAGGGSTANEVVACNSLLRHLKPVSTNKAVTIGGRRGEPVHRKSTPVAFPESLIGNFFSTGLNCPLIASPGDSITETACAIRDSLYFLILAFGALRASEPLHLFVGDIEEDDTYGQGTTIWLRHPVTGMAPRGIISTQAGRTETARPRHYTRLAYLREKYGLTPRNLLGRQNQAAGWKGVLLDENLPGEGERSRVYWQSSEHGKLFWKLHSIYIEHIRPQVAAHPYYFVSLSSTTWGSPWTEDATKSAFRNALARMGLRPDASLGLCRHAFRHRLAQRLVDGRVSPQIIQVVLHHCSLTSQLAYTRPTPAKVHRTLERADAKLSSRVRGLDVRAEDGIRWRTDPLGIFEEPARDL